MGGKGKKKGGGNEDGYFDLMTAVVIQGVEDIRNIKMPKERGFGKPTTSYKRRCAEIIRQCHVARHYIFADTSESDEYVFGFKFVMKHSNIDPERARATLRRGLPPIPKLNNLTSKK